MEVRYKTATRTAQLWTRDSSRGDGKQALVTMASIKGQLYKVHVQAGSPMTNIRPLESFLKHVDIARLGCRQWCVCAVSDEGEMSTGAERVSHCASCVRRARGTDLSLLSDS